MFQNRVTSTTVTALLRVGLLALPAAAAEPSSAPVTAVRQTSQTQELRPFTHFARIPTGSDPATMRLEKIRSVKVPISATVPSGYLLVRVEPVADVSALAKYRLLNGKSQQAVHRPV
jgi:hypothetical protein